MLTYLIILVEGYRQWEWLLGAIKRRIREELAKLRVEVNEEKTKTVDLEKGGRFSFLGFEFKGTKSKGGKAWIQMRPKMQARTKLLRKLKEIFRNKVSQPVEGVIKEINPVIRGWINYFRIGNSSRCFGYIKDWVEKKVRRHLMKSRGRKGFGWKKWSRAVISEKGLYKDYQIRYYRSKGSTKG